MNDLSPQMLKLRLDALLLLDEIMIPSEKDYLRIINSGENNQILWYILDNGCGDSLMILFADGDVLIKGFDHENELNQFAAEEWDNAFFTRMFSGIPDRLAALLTEDEHDETTFCMWYLKDTERWYQNEVSGNDGGKAYLLGYIPETADQLHEWAEDYYGTNLDADLIGKLFRSAELSAEEQFQLRKSI